MEKKTKEEMLDEVLGPIRKKMYTPLQLSEFELAMDRWAAQEKSELVEALEVLVNALNEESPGMILRLDWTLVTNAKIALKKAK